MTTVFKQLCRLLPVVICLIHCLVFSEENSEKKETTPSKPKFQIVQSGIFSTGGVKVKARDSDGYRIERSQLVTTTNTIQAKLHLSFGIRYIVSNTEDLTPVNVVQTITHPPIIYPKTKETNVQFRTTGSLNSTSYAVSLWTFDEPHEMVPGSYIFRVFHNGEKVLEEVFLITPPTEPAKKEPAP